ncbi:sensor histidine kinase [Kutzneria buriramensis]|uniref:histidine kinase n=1 Tax=Kutzneria buriramensis TaxID=1045776 RepID=A0A3E0H4R2_9PSEU|nr:histidine kinase [Kutzneria buriramensis]REH38219.1 signal transduction histidine kinase [Kutzneria buriramensis]
MARLRGLALLALGALGPVLAVADLVALIFGVTPVVLRIRRVPVVARRLAGDWCDAPIPSPYNAAPPPPRPRPDGMYEVRRNLYRTPRVPNYRLRAHWLSSDGATWLDLVWLLVNPVVGTVLGLAAAVVGQPALRWHGRWTRALLGERRPWPIWVRDRVMLLLDGGQLAVQSLAGLLIAALHVALLALAFTGVTWPVIVLVENSRGFTNHYRRRIGGIESPYRPAPTPPRPEPDGRYRLGRRLFRSPTIPVRLARLAWLSADPATRRDFLWMLLNPLVALALLAAPCVALFVGFAQVTTVISFLWRHDQVWWLVPPGAVATALALLLAPTLRRWYDRWTPVLLASTKAERLAQRVERLTETRADAVDTQAAELRRIERDLHDGAQGRLVAMGMALRTVERLLDVDPATARRLIVEVRENTSTALNEIRELVHGIHPPVLAERGLADAIRVVALDCPLDVEVAADLPGRVDPPVESAAYFAVRELLTNAAKHSGAARVRVGVHHADHQLLITVHDDGHGGADVAGGTGLLGVRRRLGTFDGVLTVLSPVGGPTTVTMEIPCELSSRRTSTCSEPD